MKAENCISFSEPEDLPEHGVTVVFVALENTKIELLFPLGEKSPIAGFLSKNSNGGIHHVCIEVDDIHAAVKWVKLRIRFYLLEKLYLNYFIFIILTEHKINIQTNNDIK